MESHDTPGNNFPKNDAGVEQIDSSSKPVKPKKEKEEMKFMEHKGIEYEEAFGKIVRKLDREQANTNENMRVAFFKRREAELEINYNKIYKKMLM